MRGMATLSVLRASYRDERATRARARRPRTPLAARIGRTAARLLPTWQKIRTTALSLTGFGFLSAAAWSVAVPLGLAAAGISILIVEYLIATDSR